MKRLAAHYIYLSPDKILKLHYVELDDENHLLGIFPLKEEIANTEFYTGVLIQVQEGEQCEIYLAENLTVIDCLPSKFSASDCRSNRHIQRLC
jgi:hypothetical protein